MTEERELAVLEALDRNAWRDVASAWQKFTEYVTSDTLRVSLAALVASGHVERQRVSRKSRVRKSSYKVVEYRLTSAGLSRRDHLRGAR